MKTRFEMADWVAQLVDVSRAVGTPAFGEALLQAANALIAVDHCTVFSFHRRALSGCLLTVGQADFRLAVRLCEEYLAGEYLNDPNLRYVVEAGASPRVILRFSPEDYPEHYRNHLIEQAQVIDAVACSASRGEYAVYCNFFRLRGHRTYDDRERSQLAGMLPVLATLAAVHYALGGPLLLHGQLTRLRTPEDEVQLLAERLGQSALDELTKREREVCFRILLGYSSEAIALHLGIATSTILTYRKRAYEKLGIVSQNELFSLYLHSLPGFVP